MKTTASVILFISSKSSWVKGHLCRDLHGCGIYAIEKHPFRKAWENGAHFQRFVDLSLILDLFAKEYKDPKFSFVVLHIYAWLLFL